MKVVGIQPGEVRTPQRYMTNPSSRLLTRYSQGPRRAHDKQDGIRSRPESLRY
jgi:hypothetical protein